MVVRISMHVNWKLELPNEHYWHYLGVVSVENERWFLVSPAINLSCSGPLICSYAIAMIGKINTGKSNLYIYIWFATIHRYWVSLFASIVSPHPGVVELSADLNCNLAVMFPRELSVSFERTGWILHYDYENSTLNSD
jgi:hypothetical protein